MTPGPPGRRASAFARPAAAHLTIAGLLLGLPVLTLPGSAGAVVRPAGTAVVMRLVDQPITVAQDGDLTLDVSVEPPLAPDATVTVEARPLPATPFGPALADQSTGAADAVTLAAPAVVILGTTVHLVVPTESRGNAPDRLLLASPGAYAITVRAATVSLSMAVVRSAGTATPSVRVALAVVVDPPLTLQPNGATSIDPAVRSELTALAGLLERSIVPITVTIRPELLRGLTRSGVPGDVALVTRLGAALARHTLLAAPYVHLDPSAAAVTATLPTVFTSQLREGEDVLSELLGQSPDRRVWVATDPLTDEGGSLVRNLGANVVLRLAGVGQAPPSGDPSAADVVGGVGSAPTAVMVADPAASELDVGSDDPLLAASTLAAELVAAHLDEAGPDEQTTGAVLVVDPSLVDPATFDAFVALVARQRPLLPVRVDETVGERGAGTPGDPGGSSAVADLTDVASTRAELVRLATTTAAILTPGDTRADLWPELADATLDSRLSAAARADYVEALRTTLLRIQAGVVVLSPPAVNLGDRSSTVPISIRNDNPFPVVVAVRLQSAKLKFPPTSAPTTVAPGATALLRIRVDARTNGRFPVTAELLAQGTGDRVGTPVTFSVRVGRLTGLGLVLSFGAGLILLTWWVQHLRRRARKRRGANTVERHPVSGATTG